ncbi:selenocysteine-specific translation elongation factor [bacterium I07]|nr:selenocysteine-specific translation elongation factor [bacterium I07]
MSDSLKRHIVLGMAGHIDHGKTEIVKALTGTDTDRLKEEKERGMTTDLGFAFLGKDITIIDVPGHEKFVKTMVAGVNTVDLALLVIAADDGVMPQTIEHLEILNLLQIPAGVVAVSKIDLVESDWLQLVLEDIRQLLKGTILDGSPIVPVSPVTGENVDQLKEKIFETAHLVRNRHDKEIFRMPVDRVFTIKGFGTVVAGTILSGSVSPDDMLELMPQKRTVRVRGVQVHDKPVKTSSIGFRTAINLMGIEKDTIIRGNVLAEAGYFRPTQMVDTHFHLLKTWKKPLKNRTRVRIHIGTDEAIARIILLDRKTHAPGEDGYAQFHFEKAMVTDIGDRFVVRSYSPVRTLGGGSILEPHAVKHKREDPVVLSLLERLKQGDPSMIVLEQLEKARYQPVKTEDLAKDLGSTRDHVIRQLDSLEKNNSSLRIGKNRWMSRRHHAALSEKLLSLIAMFHQQQPLRLGMSAAELRSRIKPSPDRALFDEMIKSLSASGLLVLEKGRVRLKEHSTQLPAELAPLKQKIEKMVLDNPFNPPDSRQIIKIDEKAENVLGFLIESGILIRLEEGINFHIKAVEQAKERIRILLNKQGEATISEIRQHLETSRKYAVPLMVYLDTLGFTERVGDRRRLRDT